MGVSRISLGYTGVIHQLVELVGGDLTILKNDGVRQWGWDSPIYEMENKSHVWNHQPVILIYNNYPMVI